VIKVDKYVPLMGSIAFGIVDRGTNLLQVRPTSLCNLNCVFCSTDSGPHSRFHKNNFIVDLNYLVSEVKRIVDFKGRDDIEINIDSVGEPMTYPEIVKLIKRCKNIEGVYKVSMQTNGVLLNKEKIKDLKKAGLDVVNFSISSLDSDLAKKLSNFPAYNIKKIKENVKLLIDSGINVRLCPVWIPKLNDDEIPKLIEFANEVGAELGIQKYEIYRYSRKVKVKPWNWWKFYDKLKKMEKEFKVKLVLSKKDLSITKAKRVPEVFKKGERVQLEVKLPGWYGDQMICVGRDRCVSVLKCDKKIGDLVNVKILETNNNLYLGEMI